MIMCRIMARKMLIDGEANKATNDERYDFDLFVIGAGSGGVRASRFSTQFGAKVINQNVFKILLVQYFELHVFTCCV